MTFLAIRGATTCDHDTKDEITKVTTELLIEVMQRNSLSTDDIISVLFTATPDIHSELKNCIRIMMHVDIPKERKEIKHVFMGNAKNLRKDIDQEGN